MDIIVIGLVVFCCFFSAKALQITTLSISGLIFLCMIFGSDEKRLEEKRQEKGYSKGSWAFSRLLYFIATVAGIVIPILRLAKVF